MTIAPREYDFVAARERLEAKPKSAGPKLGALEDAVARVKDGDHLAIGGCLYSRTPLALVWALLRRRPKHLTFSRNLMCYEGEWGMVSGAVDKVVTSWMGIGLPWGLSRIQREFVEAGRVEFEEWSHLGLGLRYRAAAMGVPFLPSLTMLGSDLMGVGGSKTVECPYTGRTLHAVPALFPDVALIHVQKADRLGNCQIDGYPHMDADIARAAATVLVTAEEIVSEDEIRLHPDRTVLPGFLVDALAHVPYGSYPHECYGVYDAEPDHFTTYVDGILAGGAAGVADYLERYVYAPASHADYLGLFGEARRADAAARGPDADDMTVSANELLAVMGARELRNDTTVFTGVGAPMMASVLAQRTHAPRLTMMVEGGVIGPTWKPGELPISTNEMRAAYRAQMLPGITDAFLLAQRGFFDVGFIGGAQIDRHGNLNTSAIGGYARPKVRLPGSGGANDIISLCREVMILTVHEKRRFTERVDFVTSPGYLAGGETRRGAGLLFGGVSRVVTTLGIFGFHPDSRRMQLLALHPGATVEQVRENTGFDVLVSPTLTTTKPPTDEELSILRMLDPKRQFIG